LKFKKEVVKLVKSVTKTAQMKSKLNGIQRGLLKKYLMLNFKTAIKVVFKENKLYTSGNAIGIKYNKKIYNNLVIIGRSVYIPTVKGYSWQIGK
jgi:hypothetical protein